MDAKDNLAAGPVALIVDPALSLNNPDSDQHTNGRSSTSSCRLLSASMVDDVLANGPRFYTPKNNRAFLAQSEGAWLPGAFR